MSGSRLMTEDMVLSMIQKVTAENDSKFKIMEKKFDDRIKLLEIRVELLEDVTLGPIINNNERTNVSTIKSIISLRK
jgi:hypothetical protein